jgi:hypothetical protein
VALRSASSPRQSAKSRYSDEDGQLLTIPIREDSIILASPPSIKFLLAHPAHLVACGFGSGLSPRAPGTVGTSVCVGFVSAATASG